MANEHDERAEEALVIEAETSTTSFRKASEELKARIAQARGRSSMPFNSTLGNPN